MKRKRQRKNRKPAYENLDSLKRSKVVRVKVISGIVTVSFLSLILRSGYLQITKGPELKTQAINDSIATIPVIPARGRIYDTNGNLLAYDKPVLSVYYTQIHGVNTTSAEVNDLIARLAPMFKTSSAALQTTFKQNHMYSTFRLFQNVTEPELADIASMQNELPGISIQTDGVREYPYGDLAGQVLGYTGQIPANQVKLYVGQRGYQLNQTIGVAGIESEYEKYLHGQVGQQIAQINTETNAIGDYRYTKQPIPGDNVQLTLDGRLQADAQNAVQHAITSYTSTSGGSITDGAAVMLDVKTGGVLAMVSYPYLDSNWFINGDFTKHANYLSTSGAEENNVIQNPHYPGSTVKPANLLTALEQGVVSPNTIFYDSSAPLLIGNYPIHEDASYGDVTPERAIAVSDDKFFYTIGLDLGKWFGSSSSSGGGPATGNLQTWRDTDYIKGILTMDEGERRFGLGALTGIDLPWEQKGFFYITDSRLNPSPAVPLNVPATAKTVKETGRYVNYGSPLDLAFTAFGQMQQFTPMELAQYVMTIANNGIKLQPHLLKDVMPPGMASNLNTVKQTPVVNFGKNVQANLHLNSNLLQVVQQGMYDTDNETDGTGFGTFGNAPYKAAGKTGTAEIVMNGRAINNSVYIGYAPYNNPQVAVAVMVPGAGFGATTAVPIARQMMDDYFKEHHEFFPQSEWGITQIPASYLTSPAYTVPEEQK